MLSHVQSHFRIQLLTTILILFVSTVNQAQTVSTLPAPTATITAVGSTTFCNGDSVRLVANTGAGLSYQWKKGANNISGANAANYYAKVAGNFKVSVTGSNGCMKNSNVIAVNVPCRVGVPETEIEMDDIKVYPNPSNGQFYVEFNEDKYVDIILNIFDVSGRQILSSIVKTNLGIYTVKGLSAGVYVVQVRKENTVQRFKVICTE